MLLTVTLNPSVDIKYALENFQQDTINRVENVSKSAGGKGLNVARVAKILDSKVAGTGFLGGALGEFIEKELTYLDIANRFIQIKEATRNCLAILHKGKQTEILEKGPLITKDEENQLLHLFNQEVNNYSVVTLSGSLPRGVSSTIYNSLIEQCNKVNTPVLLDTSGDALQRVLGSPHKPYLIKPNLEELEQLTGKNITNEQQIISLLNNEMFCQIEWIVVTLGSKGAIVKSGKAYYRVLIPTDLDIQNPVGSGDSVIAGFAVGMEKGLQTQALIRYAIATGVLNAMEQLTGHINPANFDKVLPKIEISNL